MHVCMATKARVYYVLQEPLALWSRLPIQPPLTDLCLGPVVVQPGEAGEVLCGDGGGLGVAGEGIRIGWVTHHQHLGVREAY